MTHDFATWIMTIGLVASFVSVGIYAAGQAGTTVHNIAKVAALPCLCVFIGGSALVAYHNAAGPTPEQTAQVHKAT